MTFYHPKHYAALRAARKKLQATSSKPQATDPEATSYKRQAPSKKVQASSHKLQAPKDYAPILNAKQIEGEALEVTESSESSSHKKEESSSDPQKLESHHLPDHKTQTT